MPHSHYCEKARWALDVTGIDYVEERHLPLLHRLHTRRVGGGSVPVLVTETHTYLDSSSIVRFADEHATTTRLIPTDAALRSETLELERYLDRELGPHARRWAYSQLLGSVSLLNACVSRGVPVVESAFVAGVMVIARPVIRRALRITKESAVRSLERVRGVFAAMDERLADGRSPLVGAGFGSADLTFAALASPVLLPPQFAGALPEVDQIPAAMREDVLRFRASRAGRFALDIYERHRLISRRQRAS